MTSITSDYTWLDLASAQIRQLQCDVDMFGFAQLPVRLDSSDLAVLRAEAEQQRRVADVAEQPEPVDYRAHIAPLGPRSLSLLDGAALYGLLQRVFGSSLALNLNRSSLTFYGPGDRLGPHRDEPADACFATVIAYLDVRHGLSAVGTGLELRVYGTRFVPEDQPRLTIPTRTGAVIVGRGSVFWHERPTLTDGEHVTALTTCYAQT